MKKIILLLVFSNICAAFNWDRCYQETWQKHKYGFGLGLGEALGSSTSYISSTGECSMIGQAERDKKVFLVYNFDAIKEEAAIGEGEYLETYAELSGCDANGAKMLPKYFQKNFINIFGEDVSKEPSQVYQAMEEVIGNEPALREGCRNIMGGV